jgi:hypothetical protein
MNDRMWEIAEAAKDQGPNFHYYDPVFLIEYTRLVVLECSLQCNHNEDMDLIEKHFGVEE